MHDKYYLTTDLMDQPTNDKLYERAKLLAAVRKLQCGQWHKAVMTIASSHNLPTYTISYLLTFRDKMIRGELLD